MTAMSGRRRGIAGFGMFTLLMVALFVGLGVWQLQRRVEKHALIAALTERAHTGARRIPPRQFHGDLCARSGCHGLQFRLRRA
jgi:cytochrome oxidase assembly protein ShyY1